MTKQEVIKILHKEIGLTFVEYEEEKNDEFISYHKLLSIEECLKKLHDLKDEVERQKQQLIKVIKETGEEKVVFQDISSKKIDNVVFEGKLFLVATEPFMFTGCSFLNSEINKL